MHKLINSIYPEYIPIYQPSDPGTNLIMVTNMEATTVCRNFRNARKSYQVLTQAFRVKFVRPYYVEAINGCTSMRSQVSETESLSVLELFKNMIMADYGCLLDTVTKVASVSCCIKHKLTIWMFNKDKCVCNSDCLSIGVYSYLSRSVFEK